VADKLKIEDELKVDGDRLERARGFDRKLQELGRALLAGLFMLVRNAKLYDPGNAIFNDPLEKLRSVVNTILASDGALHLQVAGDSFYLNNMLIRFDLKAAESLRLLRDEFEAHDIGGFSLQEALGVEELRTFLRVFGQERPAQAGDGAVSSSKLTAIKLRRFEKIQEILRRQKEQEAPLAAAQAAEQKLDRKRYGLVVYARSVVFMRKVLAGIRGEGPEQTLGKAQNFVQDLVDVVHGHRTNLLGLTTLNPGDELLSFHSVNVAMLSIVFGAELGLPKDRLRELGLAGLFHDLGKAELDEGLLQKRTRLTAAERNQLARAPKLGVRRLLRSAPLSLRNIQCIVTAHDCALDYGHQVKDHLGELHHVVKDRELGLFPRIIAIVDGFDSLVGGQELAPEIALNLMSSEYSHRFEPELLRIFCQLMKGYTQRVVTEGQTVELF